MMRRFAFATLLVLSQGVFAQSSRIYSISTCPAQDASTGMRISWAADTTLSGTFVLLNEKGKTDTLKLFPQQMERCEIFNDVLSTDSEDKDYIEDAVFNKCGTELFNLKPDTRYEYVISSPDGERSGIHGFRTAGARNWSACIISDFHSLPSQPQRLQSAMDMVATVREYDPSVNWVLSPGDVVSWGGSYSFWRRLFEERQFAELMWARANGNHDNWTRQTCLDRKFESPHCSFFTNTSYYPTNGFSPETGCCYHFRYGNSLFLMLDTEYQKSEEGFNKTVEWVKSVVTSARNGLNPPTFVVVCQHYEWFMGGNGKAFQYDKWAPVFDELGVDLAVAGNNHIYLRTYPIYNGAVTDGKHNGTVYLVTSASDNTRGRKIFKEVPDNAGYIGKRFSEGRHTISALLLHADRKSLSLTLLDRNGEVLDKCTIRAKK